MAHTHEYDCKQCGAHLDSADELRRHNETQHHGLQAGSSRSNIEQGNAEPIGNEHARRQEPDDRLE